VGAVCDTVKVKKKSKKDILLSFDEWNVWYNHPEDTKHEWAEAPALLENVYTFEDALEVGMLLMTLQNNCDRVKMACIAQLVNVIAPIMTQTGGKAWAQTIFYPFFYASKYGRGTTLQTRIDCPTYPTAEFGEVPYLETSVIQTEDGLVVFAVNRSLDEELELEIEGKPIEHIELHHDDLKAVNDADNARVTPVSREIGEKIILKPHSWNMIRCE
jgi:alpha-N-arabinofuranosidase